ncbi:DMBT1 [Mytilus coruscus]|uniref:DMBT1 n=1 Tax=Mytilus coruscus TaxID=42192 RepID=A0A6J8B906_MYTCO|nr:DMBT1 [Mytilus coruscus]
MHLLFIYSSGQRIPYNYVDDGSGNIWLVDIHCSGSENKLINCTYSSDASHCSHGYDVGVHCYLSCPAEEDEGSSGQRISNNYVNDGIGNIWLVDIHCSGSENKLINCTYSSDASHCSHGYDVGVHCYLSCPAEEDEGSSGQRISNNYVNDGIGNIWLVDIHCSGSENKLINCTYSSDASHCSHGYDVGVHCYLSCPAEEDEGLLRLITGSDSKKGRLEINYKGEWGTICSHGFNHVDAAVACRQLGYCSGQRISNNYVNDGIGNIWLVDIHCSGSENKLINCTYSSDASHCSHEYDVGVHCYLSCPAEEDEGSSGQRISNNYVNDGIGNIWLVDIHCSGSENKLINCTYSSDASHCSHEYDVGVHCYLSCPAEEDEGLLRLITGSDSKKGRLEINYKGEWGTICSHGFNHVDAAVACRQLGYCSGQRISNNYVNDGIGNIWLVDIHCSGSENKLINCTYSSDASHCSHGYDVGIHCYLSCPAEEDEGLLRLITGSDSKKGRLEINYKGEWGTICSHGFNHVDAAVACRQLGYCSGQRISNNYVNDGIGNIWLVDIHCSGSENKLINCTYSSDASHCSHGYDVGIHCYLSCPAEEDEGLLRLITGSDSKKGRLEINYKGEWGTICSHGFNHVDAAVACRQLGYWCVLRSKQNHKLCINELK